MSNSKSSNNPKSSNAVASTPTGSNQLQNLSKELSRFKNKWQDDLKSLTQVMDEKINTRISENCNYQTLDSTAERNLKELLLSELKSKTENLSKIWNERFELLETSIELLKKQIESICDDIDNNEQYGRRPCLILHGLTEHETENPILTATDFFNDKFETSLVSTDIVAAHRLGRMRKPGESGRFQRPLIVKFVRMQHRDMIYANKRKLKGTDIMVTENLTRERKRLFDRFRTAFFRPWTTNGNIVLKNDQGHRVELRSLSDMKAYLNLHDSQNER